MNAASSIVVDDTSRSRSLVGGVVVALAVHGAFAFGVQSTPAKPLPEHIEIALVAPPPKPPPLPEPTPPPPEPEHKKPPPPPPKIVTTTPPPETPPPSNETPPTPTTEPVPVVTGVTFASTVAASNVHVAVGNTTFGVVDASRHVDVKPYSGGVPGFHAERASTLSREARVVRDYKGVYPKELVEQNVAGHVVLLLSISKDGALVDAKIARTSGNAHLDELALSYVKRFVFAPAERDGSKADSVFRYTYTFSIVD